MKLKEIIGQSEYDFGDIFYEPVADIVETDWNKLGIEAWARKHEIEKIVISSSVIGKKFRYFSNLGAEISPHWFTKKEEATARAKELGHEKLESERKDEEKRIEQAKIRLERLTHQNIEE